MLFHNEIVPGQKISYRDLSERLGMSATPVIQALKWLEFQGLVRHEPNRGYFAEPVSATEVKEIYDLRELLEPSLLPEVAARLDDTGAARLRAALDAHIQATRDIYISNRLLSDKDFHLTLAALSGNRVKLQVLRNLFDLLYLKYRAAILFISPVSTAGDDHRQLVELLLAGRLDDARESLARHIATVREHVLDGLRHADRNRLDTSF
ncbi:MAG: GntR family transcriptional regulator [Deltaproteobacteria bacterium]|nr:GntR family transcriptional regulator [Candidatus Anaeroferrophillacea bacterium]